jgi:hypothetical protein
MMEAGLEAETPGEKVQEVMQEPSHQLSAQKKQERRLPDEQG